MMWYIVQTVSGREQAAIEKCRNALSPEYASRIFTPTCQFEKKFRGQWQTVENVAFPGYVFIESERPEELEKLLERIPDVVTPVRIGGGFYPVRAEEERTLRSMMDERDCIRTSVGYLADQELIIERGPLQGLTRSVRWIDRHRRIARVEILLFDEWRRMRVGLEVKGKLNGQKQVTV